jgi:hypothetical protein
MTTTQRPLTELEMLIKQYIISHPGSTHEDVILAFYDPMHDPTSRHLEVTNAVVYVENRFCRTDRRCTIHYLGGD